MPYDCKIRNEATLLRVDVSGVWTPGREFEDAIGVWLQVLDACQKYKKDRILAVWDVPGHLPAAKAYDLADQADARGWKRQFKLAVVHLHKERFEDSLLAETVAVNRGFSVKIFDNEPSAAAWLLES